MQLQQLAYKHERASVRMRETTTAHHHRRVTVAMRQQAMVTATRGEGEVDEAMVMVPSFAYAVVIIL